MGWFLGAIIDDLMAALEQGWADDWALLKRGVRWLTGHVRGLFRKRQRSEAGPNARGPRNPSTRSS